MNGKKEIKRVVLNDLSSISGLKILSCKLHGVVFRKRLVISGGEILRNFPLVRIWCKYKKGNDIFVRTSIVYPSDVYPYGRQTLDVVEEVAGLRISNGCSWYELESRLCEIYDFSLNRIKRMLGRVLLVFNRLLTSRIISGYRDLLDWFMGAKESFEHLSLVYRTGMIGGLFGSKDVINFKDLFSP